MSLAAYLAKNYLTADPPSTSDRVKKRRKKNKRADTTNSGGLIIADDDPPDLRTASSKPKSHRFKRGSDEEDDDTPYTIANERHSAEFRKSKKSSWKTIGGPAAPSNAEQVAADAILASAAAERAAHEAEDEDRPVIADGDPDAEQESGELRMESGARAGLQTAEETEAMVVAQQRKRQLESLAMKKSDRDRAGKGVVEPETIYRDASGRIINVAMKRAEARRAVQEAAAAEAAAKEALTGDVQRREKEARREALKEARFMPLARTVDDEEMNAELKARPRWNDPAAEFLTKGTTSGGGAVFGVGGGKSGRRVYTGPAAPNRYGIRPGHRWDGVDRGNGFEQQWFEARNKVQMRQGLEYAWAMDE
ncbi:pre-mRNA-splicing factor cwc26 [Paracoccidioides lutzii Pb01]|uniref:Pre-mRNA-splicing factor cwc26 n=1 Tax=Paracoccidioides lutzii (strain ATCC MYA-826 / Pb01) TaxID=502779 RepID=C1GSW1_PARBA|nr:pre-mRNA-splicing factor cwc26 [Paracoccidioides lutzii Pb01]EEH39144.1 pre-mRNA-splicing factor cwc26 [Paracoccidioides lutzii Pb01]